MSDAQQAQAEILALSVTVLKTRATVVESLARIRARHSQIDDLICCGAKLVTLRGRFRQSWLSLTPVKDVNILSWGISKRLLLGRRDSGPKRSAQCFGHKT
jgi:hypothetical protein